MKRLNLPQLSQAFDYDCGANALQTVFVYYGVEIPEGEIMKVAKTSRAGTPIKGMEKAAKKYGLKVTSKPMSLKEVKGYLDRKIPVILILQAWSGRRKINWDNDWKDGHYVVAIGYTRDRILFQDPYSFERTYLKYDELEDRWHDLDCGTKYFHYALAIYGKKPRFKRDKLIHMD